MGWGFKEFVSAFNKHFSVQGSLKKKKYSKKITKPGNLATYVQITRNLFFFFFDMDIHVAETKETETSRNSY